MAHAHYMVKLLHSSLISWQLSNCLKAHARCPVPKLYRDAWARHMAQLSLANAHFRTLRSGQFVCNLYRIENGRNISWPKRTELSSNCFVAHEQSMFSLSWKRVLFIGPWRMCSAVFIFVLFVPRSWILTQCWLSLLPPTDWTRSGACAVLYLCSLSPP